MEACLTKDARDAEEIAIAVLGWLSTEPEMMNRFLSLSGLEAMQLRGLAGDRDFLAGMLDFVVAHEPSLNAFCSAYGFLPEEVDIAWRRLSGPTYSGAGA